MQKPLDLLKRLDAQIATLDKIVKSGDYIGAGLDISLAVRLPAAEEDDDDVHFREPSRVDLEVTHDLPELMGFLRKGLVAARDEARVAAEADRDELSAFLASQGPQA